MTYSGLVNGETSAVLQGTLAYAYNTKADGSGTPYTAESPVGTYYIIPGGLTSANYDITFTAGTLTVSAEGAAGLSLSIDASIPAEYFTYSGTAKQPAVVVKDGGKTLTEDQDYTVEYANNINAGENTAVATVTGKGNYSGTKSLNFTIGKKALSVKASDHSIGYGDEPANNGVTYSGLVNGETSAVLQGTLAYAYNTKADGSGTPYTAESPVGTYYIIPGGLTSANYDITFTAGTLTVSAEGAAGLSLSIDASIPAEYFTYSGTAKQPAVVVKDGGKTLTEDQDYTVEYANNINAGENTAVATVTGKGNYSGTKSLNFTIGKKALTATVTAQNKIYDGNTTAEVSATVETGVTGEALNISGLKGTFSDAQTGTGKTVTTNTSAATVTAGENTKVSNYTVNYPATTTANITPATLTIKANDVEIEIGSSDPTLTYTVSGLQGTDTEESVMSGALARDKGDALGNYAISLGTLTAGNNYTISFTGATLTIYRMLNGLFSGNNEWATFTWSEDLALPAGITAYIIKAVSEGTAEATALTYIPQKVPVILKRSDTSVNSYKAYTGTGTDDVSGNLLVGSDVDDTTIVPYQDYVLYNDLFVLAGVSTVGATHAYLPADAIGSQAAARLTINAIGGIVGIDEIRTQELQDGTDWYTLNGRKLNTVPTKKGLYIKDGRKVVIK